MSGWRRSVCDCGCGDPSVCEGGGCGRCPSDDNTDPIVCCGDGTACPTTYAVTVNVPSITLEKGVYPFCDNTITFSSFTVSGVLTRNSNPPPCIYLPTISTCNEWGDGSGEPQLLGTGGGSQTVSGCSAPPCNGFTVNYIGVWCSMAFSNLHVGGVRGRHLSTAVHLRLHYEGTYNDGLWHESGVTAPTFVPGCGCLNGYTGEFTNSVQASDWFCGLWTSHPDVPTVTWAIT